MQDRRTFWAGLALALLVVLLAGQCNRYRLVSDDRAAFRLDRLTGRVALCSVYTCKTLREEKQDLDPTHIIERTDTLPPAASQ